jgi:serine/threonine protein kinase
MTAPPPPEPAHPPPLLGQRYVVRRRIGRGGTSSVYLAFDLRLRAWRATKVMHTESAGDPELRGRFLREAAAMANLEHPHVARVSDVGGDTPVPFLVMEWLEGGSAASWVMQHGPMSLELVLDVSTQVCEALAFVHGHGVVHRDVNPRNLLFDRFGTCKLTDFGIARTRQVLPSEDLDQHSTIIGTVMGTEAYMAPEQKRDSSDVDARADIYGVGATIYSLLTGRLPPDHAIASRNDPRLRKVPPEIAPILGKACADLPQDRFAHAKEMREALEKLKPRGSKTDIRALVVVEPEPMATTAPRSLTQEEFDSLSELMASGACTGFYEPAGTPSVAPRPQPPMLPGLAMVLAVMALGLSIGIGAASVLALAGARQAAEARVAVLRSELRYERAATRYRDHLRSKLETAGLDAEVAAAYTRLLDAAEDDEGRSADALYETLSMATRAVSPLPPEASRALSDLELARASYHDAVSRWEETSTSLVGRVAVTAGIVPGR